MKNNGSIFKGFAGIYVGYVGIQQLIGLKSGNPPFSVPVTILLSAFFLIFAAFCIYGSAKDFKMEKEEAARLKESQSLEEIESEMDSIEEKSEGVVDEAEEIE